MQDEQEDVVTLPLYEPVQQVVSFAKKDVLLEINSVDDLNSNQQSSTQSYLKTLDNEMDSDSLKDEQVSMQAVEMNNLKKKRNKKLASKQFHHELTQ